MVSVETFCVHPPTKNPKHNLRPGLHLFLFLFFFLKDWPEPLKSSAFAFLLVKKADFCSSILLSWSIRFRKRIQASKTDVILPRTGDNGIMKMHSVLPNPRHQDYCPHVYWFPWLMVPKRLPCPSRQRQSFWTPRTPELFAWLLGCSPGCRASSRSPGSAWRRTWSFSQTCSGGPRDQRGPWRGRLIQILFYPGSVYAQFSFSNGSNCNLSVSQGGDGDLMWLDLTWV